MEVVEQKKRGRKPILDEATKLEAREKNKQKALDRIKTKYRDDPEFREAHLARAKEYNRRCREALKIVKAQQQII